MDVKKKSMELASLHNKMISAKRSQHGYFGTLHPYLVDEATLTKKKKQPKWTKSISTEAIKNSEDAKSDFLIQAHFFKV